MAQKVAQREPEIVTRDAVESHTLQVKKGDLLVIALETGSWRTRAAPKEGFGIGRVTRFDRKDGMPYVEIIGKTPYITGGYTSEERMGTELKPTLGQISNRPYERLASKDGDKPCIVQVTRVEEMKEEAAIQKLQKDNLLLSGKDIAIIKDVSVRNRFMGGQEVQTVRAEFLTGANAGKTVEFDAKKGKPIA